MVEADEDMEVESLVDLDIDVVDVEWVDTVVDAELDRLTVLVATVDVETEDDALVETDDESDDEALEESDDEALVETEEDMEVESLDDFDDEGVVNVDIVEALVDFEVLSEVEELEVVVVVVVVVLLDVRVVTPGGSPGPPSPPGTSRHRAGDPALGAPLLPQASWPTT